MPYAITPAIYSQLDPRWAEQFIGKTRLKLRNWGCTIAASCTVLESLGTPITPGIAAKAWKFNDKGEVIWQSIPLWKWRGYGRIPDEVALANLKPGKGVIVRLSYTPRHWVAVHGWSPANQNWFIAADPYSYNKATKTCRLVKKYKKDIDGYSLFGKK